MSPAASLLAQSSSRGSEQAQWDDCTPGPFFWVSESQLLDPGVRQVPVHSGAQSPPWYLPGQPCLSQTPQGLSSYLVVSCFLSLESRGSPCWVLQGCPGSRCSATGPWAAGAEQDGKVLCISSPALQPQRSDWSGKELGGSFVKQTEMEREMGGYL